MACVVAAVAALCVAPQGHAADNDDTLPPGIVTKAEPKTFMEAVWKINANRIAGLDGTLAVLSTPQIMPAKPCPE